MLTINPIPLQGVVVYGTHCYKIFVLMIALSLYGCDRTKDISQDVAMIRSIIEQRAVAIANNDITLYRNLFLPEYNDIGVGRDQVVATMERNFKQYPHMTFEHGGSPIEITMNTARIVHQITYRSEGWEKPVYDREILYFRRVDGKWYMSAGVKVDLF